MGYLNDSMGRVGEATKIYQRALEEHEKVWGPEHTLTLRTINNLGLLYADQGKMAEAETI